MLKEMQGLPPFKGGSAPSTGMLGVYLAAALCRSVTLFGFSLEASRDAKSSKNDYHYFQNYIDAEELRAHPHHSFQCEGSVIHQLKHLQLVQVCENFKQPEVCAQELNYSETFTGAASLSR
mmetsp:Transcript_31671/g.59564  ORF Transcript_31671/g.59564 Transcript_31671/m.59564 type:complete len:121 (+) Transcript_31671:429-791(+)